MKKLLNSHSIPHHHNKTLFKKTGSTKSFYISHRLSKRSHNALIHIHEKQVLNLVSHARALTNEGGTVVVMLKPGPN